MQNVLHLLRIAPTDDEVGIDRKLVTEMAEPGTIPNRLTCKRKSFQTLSISAAYDDVFSKRNFVSDVHRLRIHKADSRHFRQGVTVDDNSQFCWCKSNTVAYPKRHSLTELIPVIRKGHGNDAARPGDETKKVTFNQFHKVVYFSKEVPVQFAFSSSIYHFF